MPILGEARTPGVLDTLIAKKKIKNSAKKVKEAADFEPTTVRVTALNAAIRPTSHCIKIITILIFKIQIQIFL